MWRMPGWMVPTGKDSVALGGCECAKSATGAAPCGGGVVPHTLAVGVGIRIETGDALLGCLGGLEFGEEGDGLGLALQGTAGGGDRDRACHRLPASDRRIGCWIIS